MYIDIYVMYHNYTNLCFFICISTIRWRPQTLSPSHPFEKEEQCCCEPVKPVCPSDHLPRLPHLPRLLPTSCVTFLLWVLSVYTKSLLKKRCLLGNYQIVWRTTSTWACGPPDRVRASRSAATLHVRRVVMANCVILKKSPFFSTNTACFLKPKPLWRMK